MTVVQHQLTQPGTGRAWGGQKVVITLAVNGYTTSGHVEIMSTSTIYTSGAGLWSIDLVPQSQIDPANTYYIVTHPDGEVLDFVVSDATGPLWLHDLLVSSPATPNPILHGIPAGGTTGQTLSKNTGSDYDVGWSSAGSGSVTRVAATDATIVVAGTPTVAPTIARAAISGDVTVAAGSNAATVTKVNGTAFSGLATGLVKNTTVTGVPSIAVAADVPTVAAGSTGPLSATDATTTNSRTPTGSAGGDLTGTYPNPTLGVAGTAGTYGDASHVAVLTTDTKGRVTAVTNTAIAVASGAVSGLAAVATSGSAADLSTGTLPAGRLPALTGDVTTTAGTVATTLATVNAGPGITGDASHVAQVTVDAKGRTTTATAVAIAITESQVTNLTSDLAAKAPLASPTLTGTPTAPTATALDNSTKLATTAYDDAAVAVEKARALAAEALLLASGAAAGGDLAGTYPNPTVTARSKVTVFTSSGTFTKDSRTVSVGVMVIGAGGGGGAGGRFASGQVPCGGGGGGPGAVVDATFPATVVPSSVTVTISAGGAGASGQTVDSSVGATAGPPASQTTFGVLLQGGRGGGGGGGGNGVAGSGGGGGAALWQLGTGASSSASGAAGAASANVGSSPGGGAGGGINATPTATNGGNGGLCNTVPGSAVAAGGTVGAGQNGTAGTSSTLDFLAPNGGAGGASNLTAAAGTGGAGGNYGAGGGGGGASLNGFTSGAGGAGGPGLIVVTEYF